jgi:hypothetical protein
MHSRTKRRHSAPAQLGIVTVCASCLVLICILIAIAIAGPPAVFTGARQHGEWHGINGEFGVIYSAFAVLALLAVGLTSWLRSRERLTADRTAEVLQQSAEVDLRARHVELLKMAIDDPALAKVWPSYGDDVTPEQTRQFLYANLILQHQALVIYRNRRDPAYIRNVVRFCFTNPIVREFWQRTTGNRRNIAAADDQVVTFEQICDEVYREGS